MTTRNMILAAILVIPGSATLAAEAPGGAPASLDSTAPTHDAPRYTGDLISISLKDAELREVFRAIHQLSGKNIVVEPSIKGKIVTIEVRDVPWDQALALVLETNGLDQATDGNVIRVFPAEAPAREGEYSGHRIDVSLKDAELREFFRLIQEVSGQNMVVDPSIAAKRITLELRDVPWDQALALVGKTNHLGRMIDGNVIRIIPIIDDPPRIALTRARLAADLGDRAEAIELFAQLGGKGPMDVRCEARVRQGALLAQEGRRREANAVYMAVDSQCRDQPEAMRLLVEVVTGVEQDPATWRGRTERVSLTWKGDPTGDVELDAPDVVFVGRAAGPTPPDAEELTPGSGYFTSEPLSISMKNADFPDTLALFSAFSGMHVEATAEALAMAGTATMELADVPGDEALMSLLASKGLRAMKVPGGLRIEPLPAGAPAPVDPSMRSVRLCLDAYKQDNGHYPVVSGDVPIDDIAALLEPACTRKLPRHAVDGSPYVYSCSDGAHYELRAEATH